MDKNTQINETELTQLACLGLSVYQRFINKNEAAEHPGLANEIRTMIIAHYLGKAEIFNEDKQ